MLKFKLFTMSGCVRCGAAKKLAEVLRNDGYQVEKYDMNTIDGLVDSAFHSVLSAPSLLLVDGNDNELYGWRGNMPTTAEIFGVMVGVKNHE